MLLSNPNELDIRLTTGGRFLIMKRREFIPLLGSSAVAWPLAARAQQAGKVYRVGFLWEGPDVSPNDLEAFRQGLRDLGYVEGRTIAIEYRWAEGKPERMRELAEELVRLGLTIPESFLWRANEVIE